MTPEQREFWEAIQTLARVTRCGKTVDLEAAADALALEQEIQARFDAEDRPALAAESMTMELAPAEFAGWQDGFENLAAFPLFTLTREIPGHPAGSSVSAETLTKAGFAVPQHPPKPAL